MSELSDVALAEFVTSSATILGLQLDAQALTSVRETMRGVLSQAAQVLEYSEAPEDRQPPVGT